MSVVHAPNRLGQCDVNAAVTALATLLGASCHCPTLPHESRMASRAAIMRVVAFASGEVASRQRRANMKRLARNQAFDAYLAEKWEAEQLGTALHAERTLDA